MIKKLLSLTTLFLATASTLFAQMEVDLQASKDNTLYVEDNGALSNGAGMFIFSGNTLRGDIRRALIAFDVAGAIPAGATVTGARLTLNMSKTFDVLSAFDISLHRVLADWGEGTSDAIGEEGGGALSTANDATWVHNFYDSSTWNTPGGDYEATASATQTIAGLGPYTWDTAGLATDVQAWLDTPAENFGWILIGDESTNTTAKRFDSKENAVAGNRPVLTVAFMTPTAAEDEAVPEGYALAQNYPNPFNPVTTIAYAIPATQPVRIDVYDLFGRVVATLVDATLPAGTHTATFDATGLASGVYTYRLATPGFSRTRQLVVLK